MRLSKRNIWEIVSIAVIIFAFDLIVKDYLFFHTIAELFSISIMFVLFAITWNSLKFLNNSYLILVGVAALFIGILDLLHTLTFTGMNIIKSPIFFANQFWVATRFFEASVLLLGLLFVPDHKINIKRLLAIYTIVTASIVLAILYFKIFPVSYIPGVGQTTFKIVSEYVIIGILICAMAILTHKKKYFDENTFYLITISIILTVLSEFCFTLYISNFDFVNKLGHILKVLSFFMIYKANIESGFKRPMETFFRDLKASEEKIKDYSIELERQITMKNRFFSIISHDLRNPFTVLFGFSELLLEKHAKYNEKEREEIIQNIYDTSQKTYRLLENLLSWSRTQTNTLPFNPLRFDIKNVLDESVILVRNNAKLKEIEMRREYHSDWVMADMDMVEAIMRNLLSNAIKYTPRGGSITIHTHRLNEHIQISVTDTGVGISEEKAKDLFQIDKAKSTKGTENETGTGLGLILTAEFVVRNKGKIWVESEKGKGSTFSFTLPVAE